MGHRSDMRIEVAENVLCGPNGGSEDIHGYQSFATMIKTNIDENMSKGEISKLITDTEQRRNEWMDKLHKKGVSTRPGTHAVHMLRYFKDKYGLHSSDFPYSWMAGACSLSIPFFNGMKECEINKVVDVLKNTEY